MLFAVGRVSAEKTIAAVPRRVSPWRLPAALSCSRQANLRIPRRQPGNASRGIGSAGQGAAESEIKRRIQASFQAAHLRFLLNQFHEVGR